MVDTRIVKDITGKVDLCETFTNDSTKKLLQVETNTTYFSPVVDVIDTILGGKPYPKYTYIEVSKTEEDYRSEEMLNG